MQIFDENLNTKIKGRNFLYTHKKVILEMNLKKDTSKGFI